MSEYMEASPVKDVSPLEQREAAIEEAAQRIAKAIADLEQRLYPLLLEEVDPSLSEMVTAVAERLPPHHARLREITEMLDRHGSRMENLRYRLLV